jgi:RND family efflux transporter MFP subunit
MDGHVIEVPAVVENGSGRKRLTITLIVLLILTIGGGAAYFIQKKNAAGAAAAKKSGDEKEKAPVPVDVAEITIAPISSYISSTANVVAENEVKIVAEAEGRVDRLGVEEGQMVQQGQALATLVRGDAQMVVEKTRVRAANARVSYARAKDLFAKGLMNRVDFEKSTMDKEVAEQELGEAEWRLSKTSIRAPFTGRVTERMITVGKHVRPGDPLFTITDFDPLIARIFLPERDVITLREGHPVKMTLRAAKDIEFDGRIRQISPVVDTATGTVKVTVEAIKPPAVVRPGAFVTVAIVRETKAGALRIPREAVIRELREAHVFVVDGKTAKRRDVSLGIEEGDYIEAISGLKAGDKVIVAGQGALKDGSAVKVMTAKS